ncbi:MAG: histidine phosphatase family protein [Polyangiales bacterium]
MSRLVLVRHGKANAFSRDDYDRLSEPGYEQSRLLGAYFGERGVTFDRVFVGPRLRQRQTHETVVAALGAPRWPAPTPLDALDEHDGIRLVFSVLPALAKEDPTLAPLADGLARGELPAPKDLLVAFRAITRRWARGEVDHDGVETWREFRRRVEGALTTMTADLSRAQSVVAFTSAGAVAAAVGLALALDDSRVLDLSWSLHNGSITELGLSEGRWGLVSFNGTPHLRDPRLVTSV